MEKIVADWSKHSDLIRTDHWNRSAQSAFMKQKDILSQEKDEFL